MSLRLLSTLSTAAAALAGLIALIHQRRKYIKSVTHLLGLETFGAYIKNGVAYRLARYLRPRAAARLSLRDYSMNRLDASSAKIRVPAASTVDLDLDTMFVPLTALTSDRSRVSANDIVNDQYRRVLLIGDPGSGKSTLVRRMYRDILRRAIVSPQGVIPVHIELKHLERFVDADTKSCDDLLMRVIRQEVTTVDTYSGDTLFDAFLEAGKLVVLLDGLDEVPTDDFEIVNRAILNLSDQLGRKSADNRLVLTTRRQLYVNLPTDLAESFDSHLTLEPFTPGDMYEFLQRWPYKTSPEEEISRIFGNLASQPNIREMCATPLVLAMYVATDQITGGEGLPETRPDFYQAVTDELIVRRRARQLGMTTGLNLLRRSRQRVLAQLALAHLLDGSQPRNALRWSDGVRIVQEEDRVDAEEAARRLRELSRDTGLFTEERREESLSFIHLTFCEFLAALAIAQGNVLAWRDIVGSVEGRGSLTPARAVERFAEVIVFAAALERNEEVRRERVRWAVASSITEIALRTVLDCQPYDDQVVTESLGEIAAVVAETPEIDRNDTWFHLFRQVATTLRRLSRLSWKLRWRSPA